MICSYCYSYGEIKFVVNVCLNQKIIGTLLVRFVAEYAIEH